MPKEKRIVAELKDRAINSLVLAVELFNRPQDRGRAEGVLILLHHAFEMLLKAIIFDREGSVHGKGEKFSYWFDKCLDISVNRLSILTSDERASLSILDAHRDIAVHFYQEVSEDLLYLQAQAGVTLFNDLLNKALGERLADHVPERVLPISTRPPRDLTVLFDSEFSQIDTLLKAGQRRGEKAAARLRPVLAMATASREGGGRVTETELKNAIQRRRRGEDWSVILPEIAQLRLDTKGGGIPIYLRIQKNAEIAVRVAKDGEPVVGTLVKQEVNIWDKFNMGRDDVANKLGISCKRRTKIRPPNRASWPVVAE